MGPYWHTRGPFSEWQPRLSRAFDLASPEPTILQMHVFFWLTLILGASPDFPAALQAANRCVEMADQVGTPSDQAAALQILAWVHECHEHFEIAQELCDQAIELLDNGREYLRACDVPGDECHHRVRTRRSRTCAAQRRTGCNNVPCVGRHEIGVRLSPVSWVCSRWPKWRARSRSDVLRRKSPVLDPERKLEPLVQTLGRTGGCRCRDRTFTAAARLLGATDQMLIVSGRDLSLHDRPGYARAETRCREALGSADFDEHRLAGSLLTPDDWLLEAREIVEAARVAQSRATDA